MTVSYVCVALCSNSGREHVVRWTHIEGVFPQRVRHRSVAVGISPRAELFYGQVLPRGRRRRVPRA